MKSPSRKPILSSLGHWLAIIPVALLSLPLLSSAQTSPTYSVTVSPDGLFTLSAALQHAEWFASFSYGPPTGEAFYIFKGGPLLFVGDDAIRPRPVAAEGNDLITGTGDFLVVYTGDVPLMPGTVYHPFNVNNGDTGIVVEDYNGNTLGDLYFFDSPATASVPDNATKTLTLLLMAIAALFGAARFKLIPLASECRV